MECLKWIIDNQVSLNAGKNLYNEDGNQLLHSKELINATDMLVETDDLSIRLLIDYAVKRCIREFCRVNQYYSFSNESQEKLKKIYTELACNIQRKILPLPVLLENHRIKLKNWLLESNPFSFKIYSNEDTILNPVACSEYTPELQLQLLNIRPDKIIAPVLDVGCGTKAGLVSYLRAKGIEAYGIDRFTAGLPYVETSDWLEYDYGTKKWGTIISHLGFSNHFMHHHLRTDGRYIEYAEKFMQILTSLKTGGSFCYAPGLRFIEQYLDKKVYDISGYEIDGETQRSTVIKKLK